MPGTRGRSALFRPDIAKEYPKGLRFKKTGYPDFTPYVKKTVRLRGFVSRGIDERAANLAAGYRNTPTNYTWHHVEDGRTMQLVPTNLRGAVGHYGGFSITGQAL